MMTWPKIIANPNKRKNGLDKSEDWTIPKAKQHNKTAHKTREMSNSFDIVIFFKQLIVDAR